MSAILTAAAGSNAPAQTIDFAAITTYKLAENHPEWEFVMPPNWATRRRDLSAAAKLIQGFFNTRGGRRGFVDNFTREQIADTVGLSLAATKRGLVELNHEQIIMSIKRGNGQPAVHVLLAHPDMGLSTDELKTRRAKLPTKIQWLMDREIRRRSQAVSTASPTADHGSSTSHDDLIHGSSTSHPKEIKVYIKDTFKDMAMPMAGPMPAISSATDIISAAGTAPTAAPTIPDLSSPPKTTRSPKKSKPRRPRSHHSLEMCQRFAQAERDRKGTIESVKDFAEACYYTGRHDTEISRWLRKRAALEVGRYTPTKTSSAAPAASMTQNSTKETPAPAAREAMARQLEEELALEAKREQLWEDLLPDDKERAIRAKIEQMKQSAHAAVFARMTAEQRRNHATEQIKRELTLYPPEERSS
jgi:hypothetical protein